VAKKARDKELILEILVGIGGRHGKLFLFYMTKQVRGLTLSTWTYLRKFNR